MHENHVNGWPVIEKYLRLHRKRQSDLAAHLALTRSAVTQIKSGRCRLNAEQIASIQRFLDIRDADAEQLLSDIVNARLPGFNLRVIPAAR